jgi:hypothetical protein
LDFIKVHIDAIRTALDVLAQDTVIDELLNQFVETGLFFASYQTTYLTTGKRADCGFHHTHN